MPRFARTIAEGYPHHVLQSGNNNNKIFFDEKDRLVYLYLLKKYTEKWACPVFAYCLMPNHVHLLVKPLRKSSLSKAMQGVTLCYTQYINKKYGKSGRLWGSRYYSCIVDKENYLWAVTRYIEQNPTRAGLVNLEEEYLYSSARAHVTGIVDEVLGGEIFGEEGRSEYVDFLHSPVNNKEVNEITNCTRSGLPFGSNAFVRSIGQSLGVDLVKKPRGRPRKNRINKPK